MSYVIPPFAVDLARRIDRARFLRVDTVEERLMQTSAVAGRRLYTQEAAEVWFALLRQALGTLDDDTSEILIREVLAMAPDHALSALFYAGLMQPVQPLPEGSLVCMVTSCEKYLAKAMALADALETRGARVCVVTGNPALKLPRWFGRRCVLPVPDNYESLPDKVLQGIAAIVQRHGRVAILKIDDDGGLDAGFDAAALQAHAARADYRGRAVGDPMHDRSWHVGKTEARHGVYRRRFHGAWASGEAYLLSARAAGLVAEEATLFPGEFTGVLYEDKAVGDFLRRQGIALTPIGSHANWGLHFDFVERPLETA